MNLEHLLIVVGLPVISILILINNFLTMKRKDMEKETIRRKNCDNDINILKKDFTSDFKTELFLNIQMVKDIEEKLNRISTMYDNMFNLVHNLEKRNSTEHGALDKVLQSHTKHLITIGNLMEKLTER